MSLIYLENSVTGWVFIIWFGSGIVSAQATDIVIGTGSQTGVYYVVGQSVCRLVNRGTDVHGISCSAPSTEGSVANVATVRSGEHTMGVVASHIQYCALSGSGEFQSEGAFSDMRTILSAHPEPLTLVARLDSGIEEFTDLRGKRVDIGPPNSDTQMLMREAMKAFNLAIEDFSQVTEEVSRDSPQLLSDNEVDVVAFSGATPNTTVQEATTTTEAVIIPVTGPTIDQLVSDSAGIYERALIAGGMYKDQNEDITTFGYGATLIVHADTPDDVVFEVTKSVFDNFDRFTRLHPAFSNLQPNEMACNFLTAPLHPGAAHYYALNGIQTCERVQPSITCPLTLLPPSPATIFQNGFEAGANLNR